MKTDILIKTAIASAVIAATTATTVADTKLYGRMRAGVVCTDGDHVNLSTGAAPAQNECALENRSSRFGIKVDQAINDNLTAFGKYEFAVDPDEGALSNGTQANRLAYVGLKGGFGEVSIGSRWSPMYNYVASPVDPFQLLGGTSGNTVYSSEGHNNGYRTPDTVNYKNKFGAVGMHLQVQMDEALGNNDIDAVSIGAGGKLGSVNVGAAYRDRADVDSTFGIHAGTKFGPVGLGLSYMSTDVDAGAVGVTGVGAVDHDEIMALASYGMGGGRTINLGLGQLDADGAAGKPLILSAEYEHKLSKNYRWFAAVQNTDWDGIVAGSDDELKYGAGMRLEF